MDIPVNGLMGGIASSTTSTISSLSPILVMICGLLLAFFFVSLIINMVKPNDREEDYGHTNDSGGKQDESERRYGSYERYKDKHVQEKADKTIEKK